ncbi:hypothetical protein BW730_09620 [Tessaracoccus aquimaris]|uniref:Uncharacterized protein n=1 Tax=Tessaracoccus aquimaris TaxID=1332264 RepID=A0A1Q2CNT8_9ACTN|nr:hypothetical protein BW730_09620 [Tessaracoccus aquimaris]
MPEQHRLLVVIIGYESCDVTMVDATGAVIATGHALMSPSPVDDIVEAVDRVVADGDSPVLGGVIAVMGIVQGENSVRSNRYPWLGSRSRSSPSRPRCSTVGPTLTSSCATTPSSPQAS